VNYTGICIWGHKEGEMLSCIGPVYEYNALEPIKPQPIACKASEVRITPEVYYTRFYYYFYKGFWVHSSHARAPEDEIMSRINDLIQKGVEYEKEYDL